MTTHKLGLKQHYLIGSLTNEVEPILTINSGDTVEFSTPDAAWGIGDSYSTREKPFQRRDQLDAGHACIGPLYIQEAKPGTVLEITFNDIVPGSYGFTFAGKYPNWQNIKLNLTEYDELGVQWTIDKQTEQASCVIGSRTFTVPIQPFMGVIGMPPQDKGVHSTWFPLFSGGNIDCKALTKGSKLYLPVTVEGGYLAIGDGHAKQGDGEISCQAIECPMEHVSVTINVLDNMSLSMPRALTEEGWLTFGFHEDLNEATVQALDDMLTLIGEQYGLNRVEAIALGSAVVDLRITQVVNHIKGVHAVLPHSTRGGII